MLKFTVVSLLLISMGVSLGRAHNSQVSAVRISKQDSTWSLVMSASLSAFHYELETAYPEKNFRQDANEELIALLMRHLQATIEVTANGKVKVQLENGGIHPGHQTDVVFELKGMPDDLTDLSIRVNCFSSIPQHTSILIVSAYNKNNKFFLAPGNDHQVSLKRDKDLTFKEIPAIRPASKGFFTYLPWIGLASLGFVVIGGMVFWRKYW